MFELSGKILIAGLLLFASGATGVPDFGVSWKASLAIAALAAFGYQLERRGYRNPGIAGFFAVTDAAIIAFVLASAGKLDSLGFLVLAPCAFATMRHRAQPVFMAPLATASLLVAHSLSGKGDVPGVALLAQMAGVLAIGLLFPTSRHTITTVQAAERISDLNLIPIGPPDAILDLRENYRKLRDAYQDLDRRSRRDRRAALLGEARNGPASGFFRRLAERLAQLSSAEKVVLYTMAGYGGQFVVRSTHGDLPPEMQEAAIEVDPKLAPILIRESAERSIQALRQDAGGFANMLLLNEGKVVGMVALWHDSDDTLEEARREIDDSATTIAAMISDALRREDVERRLRESELLYDMAALASGAESRTSVAARFTREIFEMLGADHVGIYLLDGGELTPLSREGADVRLLESMSFATGPGLNGWMGVEAPELLLADVRADSRCPASAAIKARVGSYCVIPLQCGEQPFGVLTAATHRTGGLDLPAMEVLRVSGSELSHALAKYESEGGAEGVMNPREFQTHVGTSAGSLVVLEALRRDQLVESLGRAAVNHALRKFARRVRARLPVGGAVCRRPEGDYLVFLPGFAETAASRWANELSATASMIGLRTPDGSTKIPLALRAKVAEISPQTHQFFQQITA